MHRSYYIIRNYLEIKNCSLFQQSLEIERVSNEGNLGTGHLLSVGGGGGGIAQNSENFPGPPPHVKIFHRAFVKDPKFFVDPQI